MTRIDGKVAIITGGARGQGAATAKLFRERGASVYITDVDEENGAATAKAAAVAYLAHDVTSQVSWSEVVGRVVEETGRVDVLINNAGIIEWMPMTTTPLDVWNRIIAVNQTGPLLGMQEWRP